MSGRPPTRSESAPAMGATIIGMSVQGRTRSPASSGECPSAACRYCDIRKRLPNSPPYMKKLTALAAANSRARNSRSGSIGASVRRSQARNAASRAAPATAVAITSPLAQPAE